MSYTYRFEEAVLRSLIGSTEEDVARRWGISAETVALIVGNQLGEAEAGSIRSGRSRTWGWTRSA